MLALPHRAAYHVQHAALRYPLVAVHQTARLAAGLPSRASAASLEAMRQRYLELLERDLSNVEQGFYPKELLFQLPLREYARQLPRLLLDLPRVMRRSRRRDFRDLPSDVALEAFPPYFRRTFHWQTDGYLSRRSAELYDVGVELLFLGCADTMRRQVIPPLARMAKERRKPLRILDVACGTGRTLAQLGRAMPEHHYYGVDLSPYYAALARERLIHHPRTCILAENAEALPFREGYFDAIVSVFLFHELPRNVRRNVLSEMRRTLKPGGLLVLEDSAQLAESEKLAYFLGRFAEEMHEPFYRDYIDDDLAEAARETGFQVQDVEPAWVSKVVTAVSAS